MQTPSSTDSLLGGLARGLRPLHGLETWLVRKRARSAAARYAVALGASFAALGVYLGIQGVLAGGTTAALLFIIAIMIGSWYGGFRAGLLTTFVSALLADFFLIHPVHSLRIADPGDGGRLFLFAAAGGVISYLNHLLHVIARRSEAALTALQRSNERFKILVEGVRDHAIIRVRPDGCIDTWNVGAERIFGQTAADVAARPFDALFAESARAGGLPAAALDETSRNGHYEFESALLKKDGAIFWGDVVLTLLRDDAGETRGFALLVRDSTERKRNAHERERLILSQQEALQSLYRSESRFGRLFDSNILGLVFMDLDGRISQANDAFLKVLGYSRDDLAAGRVNWHDAGAAEYRAMDQRAVREVKRSGACIPYERQCLRKDGSRIAVMAGLARLEFAEEECIAFVLDVTEQHHARDALQQREELLGALIDSLYDSAVFTLDAGGAVTGWNPAAQRFHGFSAAEVGGRHLSALYPPGEEDRAREDLREAAAEGCFRGEGWRASKDAGRVYCDVVVTALREGDGGLKGFCVLFRRAAEPAAALPSLPRLARAALPGNR